jgi:hypothetical protein
VDHDTKEQQENDRRHKQSNAESKDLHYRKHSLTLPIAEICVFKDCNDRFVEKSHGWTPAPL